MSLHRELITREIETMDREAKDILSLINDALPHVQSDLSLRTVALDKINPEIHPIERMTEYRILAGKISMELTRLENITSTLRRRVEGLSDNAQKLNKLAAWTPELVLETLRKEGRK